MNYVKQRCADGMPCHPNNGWVHIPSATAWLAEFNRNRDSIAKSIEMDEAAKRARVNGCMKLADYARLRGISASGIKTLVRDGMPIKTKTGDKWATRYVFPDECDMWRRIPRSWAPSNQRRPNGTIEGEYLSGQRFCLLFSSSLKAASKKYGYLKSRGLPIHPENGWVHIQRGLEWVRDNTNIQIPASAWPKATKSRKRDASAEARASF